MSPENRTRAQSREAPESPWAQAADAHNLPQAAEQNVRASECEPAMPHAGVPRNRGRTALRVVRDAALGLLLIAAIPLGFIAATGDTIRFNPRSATERIAETDRLRPLMLTKDGRMSPVEAGYALHSLHPSQEHADFPLRAVPAADGLGWKNLEANSHLFADFRAPASAGLPASTRIVAAAAVGFSDEELLHLRSIAEAPVWAQIDEIARASEVDVIGGRFVLPFRTTAPAFLMPIQKFASTKELAYAGVSRAAYYLAIGERAQAEAALKSIVSFGFVLIDNGTSAIDGLIGAVVANIGRDGLHQFYSVTGDAHGKALTAAPAQVRAVGAGPQSPPLPESQHRASLMDAVGDPRTPRTIRYESLLSLSASTCGSVKGVLFGHTAEIESGFREARTSLARFPSELALLDLYYALPEHTMRNDDRSLLGRVVMGAAAVTGTITQNPRVVACTRLLLSFE